MRKSLFAAALVVAAFPALAEIYRWVDADGQVHYSQTPPAGGAEAVRPGVAPAQPPSAGQQSIQQYVDAMDKQREEEAKARAEAEQKAAERKPKCDAARARLEHMDQKTARRLGRRDEQGNLIRITDEEFAEERKKVQKEIADNC